MKTTKQKNYDDIDERELARKKKKAEEDELPESVGRDAEGKFFFYEDFEDSEDEDEDEWEMKKEEKDVDGDDQQMKEQKQKDKEARKGYRRSTEQETDFDTIDANLEEMAAISLNNVLDRAKGSEERRDFRLDHLLRVTADRSDFVSISKSKKYLWADPDCEADVRIESKWKCLKEMKAAKEGDDIMVRGYDEEGDPIVEFIDGERKGQRAIFYFEDFQDNFGPLEKDVLVYMPVDKNVKMKDVEMTMRSNLVEVYVQDRSILRGEPYLAIDPANSEWNIEIVQGVRCIVLRLSKIVAWEKWKKLIK